MLTNQKILSRGKMPESLSITANQILKMATIGGAQVLGLSHKTGSLTVGKKADITLINTNEINLFSVNDIVSSIVLQATPAHVNTISVAGKVLNRHGKTPAT